MGVWLEVNMWIECGMFGGCFCVCDVGGYNIGYGLCVNGLWVFCVVGNDISVVYIVGKD